MPARGTARAPLGGRVARRGHVEGAPGRTRAGASASRSPERPNGRCRSPVASSRRCARTASRRRTRPTTTSCSPTRTAGATSPPRRSSTASRTRRSVPVSCDPGSTSIRLRHTYATTMASSGAPLVALQRWMGHADIATTMIYAAWSDAHGEQAWADHARFPTVRFRPSGARTLARLTRLRRRPRPRQRSRADHDGSVAATPIRAPGRS